MKTPAKKLLKNIGLYHFLQSAYRNGINQVTRLRYKTSYKNTMALASFATIVVPRIKSLYPEYPTPDTEQAIVVNNVIAGYGENVYCPSCLSKNRERLVKEVIDHYINAADKTVLHFSPEKHLNRYLKTIARVTSVDIEPGFYKTIDPNIQYGDATRLSIADNTYDIVIANHILEHIPNDRLAMAEMFRILKQGGVAVLQAPWSQTLTSTIEEPSISDRKKQAALYGQKDHVRIYSLNDYVERLKKVGFSVTVLTAQELEKFRKYATQIGEPVVLGYK